MRQTLTGQHHELNQPTLAKWLCCFLGTLCCSVLQGAACTARQERPRYYVQRAVPIEALDEAACYDEKYPSLACSADGRAFADRTPQFIVPAEIALPSNCETEDDCRNACEHGSTNACTRFGDRLFYLQPEVAEKLWFDACLQRDGEACSRVAALIAAVPRLADKFTYHACAYGFAPSCSLLGTIVSWQPQQTRLWQAPTLFERACALGLWPDCVQAKELHESIGSDESKLKRLVLAERALQYAIADCNAGREYRRACRHAGEILEATGQLERARSIYRTGCLFTPDQIPLGAATSEGDEARQLCRKAHELSVAFSSQDVEEAKQRKLRSGSGQHKALHTSGEKNIAPPESVRLSLSASGGGQLVAHVEICLAPTGLITSLRFLQATQYRDYNLLIIEKMRSWRYRLDTVNGEIVVPDCHVVIFRYKQTGDSRRERF